MKIVLSAFVASITLGALAMGCSNESTDSVNTDSAINAFQNPTGSFDKSSGADAFSSFKSEQSESGKVQQPDGKSGPGTQSLRTLTRTLANTTSSCSEGQSCACQGGGSFVYSLESSKAGQSARINFNKCIGDNNTGFDGQMIVLVTSQPILGIGAAQTAPASGTKKPSSGSTDGLKDADSSSSSTSSAADKNILIAAKGNAIEGQKRVAVEFALLKEGGWLLLAVEVKDGKVVLGVAPNRDVFVKAKQGSWICSPRSTKGYQCKAQGSGEDLDLEDAETAEAPSEEPSSQTGTGTGSEELPPSEEADGSGF
jgi:hypothetical protein